MPKEASKIHYTAGLKTTLSDNDLDDLENKMENLNT